MVGERHSAEDSLYSLARGPSLHQLVARGGVEYDGGGSVATAVVHGGVPGLQVLGPRDGLQALVVEAAATVEGGHLLAGTTAHDPLRLDEALRRIEVLEDALGTAQISVGILEITLERVEREVTQVENAKADAEARSIGASLCSIFCFLGGSLFADPPPFLACRPGRGCELPLHADTLSARNSELLGAAEAAATAVQLSMVVAGLHQGAVHALTAADLCTLDGSVG